MKVVETSIPGVQVWESTVFRDQRGLFLEAWRQEECPGTRFVQDNLSVSATGVLRGLHFQWPDPQGKLVRCLSGRIFDVAVDIRSGSPSFGRWVGEELSLEDGRALFVPEGFAHGFCVISGPAIVAYKCTAPYLGANDAGVAWNDPDIGIDWPVKNPLLSEKDSALPLLRDLAPDRLPNLELR